MYKDLERELLEIMEDEKEQIAQTYKDLWEVQDRLTEIERMIIKGEVVELEMDINIRIRSSKDLEKEKGKEWRKFQA